jgi:hypothetical protein
MVSRNGKTGLRDSRRPNCKEEVDESPKLLEAEPVEVEESIPAGRLKQVETLPPGALFEDKMHVGTFARER